MQSRTSDTQVRCGNRKFEMPIMHPRADLALERDALPPVNAQGSATRNVRGWHSRFILISQLGLLKTNKQANKKIAYFLFFLCHLFHICPEQCTGLPLPLDSTFLFPLCHGQMLCEVSGTLRTVS